MSSRSRSNLLRVVGLRLDHARLPILKLLQDFIHQFEGDGFAHAFRIAQRG
jgi:hypothetical protein